MVNPLLEIGSVIILATLLGYAARLLKQPMILGYIAAGFIIGPYVAGLITNTETILLMSELGIAFVLFVVGLELDLNKLKDSGLKAGFMGVGQVIFTAIAGFFISRGFGFEIIPSLYIAIALTFSSTMIAIKLMSDKGTLDTIHGRLVIGMLIFQDIIAILILTLLPSLGSSSSQMVALSLGKGLALIAAAFIASKTLIPFVFNISARSTELLFLSSISLLFGFSFLADYLGYSVAIGSFIAGVALASTSYQLEVVSRVKSLRDFFATVFFVSLGMQIALPALGSVILPVLAFSAFVLIGNPLIVALIGLASGYNKRISILSGLPMGQISEFSLIVASLGVSLGHISAEISAIIIAVAAITITLSTYLIKYDEEIYRILKKILKFKSASEDKPKKQRKCDVILCGYNRIGYSIANKLTELGKSFVVVDFDPDVIRKLRTQKVPCIYGDIGDVEFLRSLGISSAGLVVSTIPGLYENELIIKEAKKGKSLVIATSTKVTNALKLYDFGADYVILPHFIGGEHVALLLDKFSHMPSMLQHKFEHIRELHMHKMNAMNNPI